MLTHIEKPYFFSSIVYSVYMSYEILQPVKHVVKRTSKLTYNETVFHTLFTVNKSFRFLPKWKDF